MAEYQLYVFELSDSVASRKGVPARRSSHPYVYVGYTSRARRVRLKEHRHGRFFADKKWAPHYVTARPDLYRLWPTYEALDDALAGELRLATGLDRRGFTVVNKTGTAITIDRRAARQTGARGSVRAP